METPVCTKLALRAGPGHHRRVRVCDQQCPEQGRVPGGGRRADALAVSRPGRRRAGVRLAADRHAAATAHTARAMDRAGPRRAVRGRGVRAVRRLREGRSAGRDPELFRLPAAHRAARRAVRDRADRLARHRRGVRRFLRSRAADRSASQGAGAGRPRLRARRRALPHRDPAGHAIHAARFRLAAHHLVHAC